MNAALNLVLCLLLFSLPVFMKCGVLAKRRPRRAVPPSLAPSLPIVAVMILSRRENAGLRDAIRRAWIAAPTCQQLFFVGHPCPHGTDGFACPVKSIASRRSRHGDTVTLAVTDVYRHLPRKLKLAYAWTLAFTQAEWLVKADEDFFVNGPNLVRTLAEYPATSQLVGCIMRDARVHRVGKWKEDAFQPHVYPPFPLGSCGHAVTRDVAAFVVRHDGYEYQGEDTSLGIWLRGTVRVTMSSTPHFTNTGVCADASKAIMGHQFKAMDMPICHRLHASRAHGGVGRKKEVGVMMLR